MISDNRKEEIKKFLKDIRAVAYPGDDTWSEAKQIIIDLFESHEEMEKKEQAKSRRLEEIISTIIEIWDAKHLDELGGYIHDIEKELQGGRADGM